LFIVHGTVGLAFAQRRGAIRTLRALGASLKFLTLMILGEILVLAMAGGLLGIALGYVVAGALLPDVAATLRGLYGAQVDGTLTLRPGWVLTGLAMSVAGTLVASLGALWRISRMPLLSSAGQRAWGLSTKSLRLLLGTGVGLLVAGAMAPVAVGDLAGGFMLMGGLLTGSALLLPAVLNKIIQIAQQYAHHPVTEWIWADMRAQLPGLSLALMALLLALAANIGVGTMVSSFRLTFQGWLDQRLASEIYLTARDDEQGGAIANWLEGRAEAVLPIRAVELDHATGPVFLYGIVDHDTYRANWQLIAQGDRPWARLAEGAGILINEQLARKHEIWPGDSFAAVPDWPLTVVGVYSDYGNPTGQAIVALDQLLERFPEVQNRRFGIRVAPDVSDALVADLYAAFDLPSGAVIRQSALKQQSMAIFEKTFLVTAALNVLTLGVAGFAIFTSLLTLWSQRLPQVAPIWALGMTRSNIARLELLRSLVLTSLTALLALPLGLVLAWALLAVVNVEAFGWRLPMHLFPGEWIKLFALALIAGAAAAALPAYRLSRLPPASMLRVFADER
ncbi:MAG: ABC transporter permease, partial [Pseudomonadota bacterium]